MTKVSIAKLTGARQESLAGQSLGRKHFPLFLSAVSAVNDGELIVWSFSGIVHASASYLSATVGAVLRLAKSGQVNKFFAFSDMNADTLDDLCIVLTTEKLASFIVREWQGQQVKKVERIGVKLEGAYERTFSLLDELGTATAESLMESSKDDISKTGWLNRLNYLNRMGLVRRQKESRELLFAPAYREIEV